MDLDIDGAAGGIGGNLRIEQPRRAAEVAASGANWLGQLRHVFDAHVELQHRETNAFSGRPGLRIALVPRYGSGGSVRRYD